MHETFRRGGKYSLLYRFLSQRHAHNSSLDCIKYCKSGNVNADKVIVGVVIVVFLYIFKRNAQFDKFAYCRNEKCHGPAETEHEDIVELETNAERFEPLKLPPVGQKRLFEIDKEQIKKEQKPTAGKKLPRKRKEVKKCEVVQDQKETGGVTWALYYSFCRLLLGRKGHPRERKLKLKQQKRLQERKARNRLTKSEGMYCFTLRILPLIGNVVQDFKERKTKGIVFLCLHKGKIP